MTNDLKNFLEVKLKEVEDNTNLLRGLPNDDEALDLIMKTYTEVSNFVLDLVEKEVEKKKKENIGTHVCFPLNEITFTSEIDGKKICVHKHHIETYNLALNDISTIINQLKV